MGTQVASTAPADGYTLTVTTTSTHVVGPLMYVDTVKYDPIKGFAHIGMIGETPYVLVFHSMAGLKMEHIPYAGSAEAVTALMGGEVNILIGSMPGVLAQIRAGSVKALAVSMEKRSPQLPEVPTMQEAGVPGYRALSGLAFQRRPVFLMPS